MLITFLLDILFAFLNTIFGALAAVVSFVGLNAGISAFFAWVYQFNGFLPIDTAYRYIGYTVYFWLAVFLFDFFKWVIHLVRGN